MLYKLTPEFKLNQCPVFPQMSLAALIGYYPSARSNRYSRSKTVPVTFTMEADTES